MEKQLDENRRRRSMNTVAFELDQINRWASEQKRIRGTDIGGWEAYFDQIDQMAGDKVQDLILNTKGYRDALASLSAVFPGLLPFLHEFNELTDGNGKKAGEAADYVDILSDALRSLGSAFSRSGG